MSKLTLEKVSLLMQLVVELNVPYRYEQSFHLQKHIFLPNRFLLSINRRLIRRDSQEKIIKLCNALNIPEEFIIDIEEKLPISDFIHFGFEENNTNHFYKIYLEFKMPSEQFIKQQFNWISPILNFQGYKWDSSNLENQFLTYYWLYPSLSMEYILEKIFNIYSKNIQNSSFRIVKNILNILANKVDIKSLRYLEIMEEGNPRKSYDINVYNAEIQLNYVYSILMEMFHCYSIPQSVSQSFYYLIKNNTFGHIAGGIHRNGQDFFNVYHKPN
jgi:hypothetical protein